MKKVMFVCSGNICRSTMAEGLLREMAKQKRKEVEVYSCGTGAYTGDLATYNAIQVMKEYDVYIGNHMATNMLDSNIQDMDIILCATQNHKNYVSRVFPELKDRTFTMKEYVDPESNDIDIKDPWGYDIEIYRHCAKEICECLKKLIEKV